MQNADRIQFGRSFLHHACGGELAREDTPRADGHDVFCEGCGSRWTVDEWDATQRELTALGALVRPLYGPGWREIAGN